MSKLNQLTETSYANLLFMVACELQVFQQFVDQGIITLDKDSNVTECDIPKLATELRKLGVIVQITPDATSDDMSYIYTATFNNNPNQNNTNKESVNNMNNQTNLNMVKATFECMAQLILKKGDNKKMISTFDIRDDFKLNNINTSLGNIEQYLDKLIGLKYVRYYRNEKGYMYYGVTQFGWEIRDKYTQPTLTETTTEHVAQSEVAVTEEVVQPEKKKRGRPRKVQA